MKTYPRFYSAEGGDLYAFLSPDRCFHLKMNGWGKGDGFAFNIYKTKATVKRHERCSKEVDFPVFKLMLSTIFADYLTEITELLPKSLIEQPQTRQLAKRK